MVTFIPIGQGGRYSESQESRINRFCGTKVLFTIMMKMDDISVLLLNILEIVDSGTIRR